MHRGGHGWSSSKALIIQKMTTIVVIIYYYYYYYYYRYYYMYTTRYSLLMLWLADSLAFVCRRPTIDNPTSPPSKIARRV